MAKIIINGPAKLKGSVKIEGSKNAALPIISATLLTRGKTTLSNVPEIEDVRNMLRIIEELGGTVEIARNNVVTIDTTKINGREPNRILVRRMRASILLVGPLLARNGKVNLPSPGGCFIGNRPLDAHFKALSKMGATVSENNDTYSIKAQKLIGTEITLNEMSVTATENIIMAAVLAEGSTTIKLAAVESHVQDLCRFLNKMGAKIEGIGTHELFIRGVKELLPINYRIISDEIEAGTYIIAAAATNGEVVIENIEPEKMNYSFLQKLKEANVNFKTDKNSITIEKSSHLRPVKIWTAPAPHFPTDLQAPFAILATLANGSSYIHESMYEGRLNYLKELKKMGANATIADQHRAIIVGPTTLYGKKITTLDLRAGATLIIAALIAEGESTILNAEIIDRGYQNIVEKLTSLGAKITRLEEKKGAASGTTC